jgi:hypothetical protein
MMTSSQLQEQLGTLQLAPAEAAQLLGVDLRTIRGWLDGEAIPRPVEQTFLAWRRLHDHKLPWRPDIVATVEDDQQQIDAHRAHAIAELIGRVEGRGGARLPWAVDRDRNRAILGPMEISYYPLADGGFSLANYTRKDRAPDVHRDRDLIEDAAYCIAKDLAATTIHIFRCGRSQDVPGMWRYVTGRQYDPAKEVRSGLRPFDPGKALDDITAGGYHLFEATPRAKMAGTKLVQA